MDKMTSRVFAGKPGYDATVVYDVCFLQFMVKRFDNAEDALKFAKNTEEARACLVESYPHEDFTNVVGEFKVSEKWSNVLKRGTQADRSAHLTM